MYNVIITSNKYIDDNIRRNIIYPTWKKSYNKIFKEKEIVDFFDDIILEKRSWESISWKYKNNFFAKINEEVVGIATSGVSNYGFGELKSLYVLPEYQNRGIGSLLWEKVIDFSENHYCHNIRIWTMARSDSGRFYKKKGCEVIKSGDYYIGDHLEKALCYEKKW